MKVINQLKIYRAIMDTNNKTITKIQKWTMGAGPIATVENS